jgi:hypothetical protein
MAGYEKQIGADEERGLTKGLKGRSERREKIAFNGEI